MDYIPHNVILQEDCLDGITRVKGGSVSLILSDPPYFLGMSHNSAGKRSFVDLAICKPFFKILFEEYKRVLTPDGQVYFFTDWRGFAFYYPIFDSILGCRNLIVWDKMNGPGTDYKYQHEFLMWYAPSHIKKSEPNVWRSPGFGAGAKATNGEKVHPTQKTIEIIEKIVTENTKPGDLVLDTFGGSGTTGVACRKTGRDYIIFELDEENFDISQRRANIGVQRPMFERENPGNDNN